MTRVSTQLRQIVALALLLGLTACSDEAAFNAADAGLTDRSDAATGTDSGGGDSDVDGAVVLGTDSGMSADGGGADSGSGGLDATVDEARMGPAPVVLGASGNYVILAKSAISNVPTSAITGDVGLSPAAATYITGFSLTRAGTMWSSSQVTGDVFAADNDPSTPADLTTAVGNMETAYTDAAGRPAPTSAAFLNVGAGSVGGMTLAPGLYKWTTAVTIPTDLTLVGGANDTWIFQIAGNLSMAAGKRVELRGGAQAKNIVWQVAGSVELGTTAHFEGVVLTQTAITLNTGASINGRLLAQTAVNLAGATVIEPAL